MSNSTTAESLSRQVSGNHYSKLKIGPTEFVMANDWDHCASCIVKYVTRHQDKNGLADLQKADHYADLRFELHDTRWHMKADKVTVRSYCLANNLGAEETAVLHALKEVVWNNSTRAHMELKTALAHLMQVRYGNPA